MSIWLVDLVSANVTMGILTNFKIFRLLGRGVILEIIIWLVEGKSATLIVSTEMWKAKFRKYVNYIKEMQMRFILEKISLYKDTNIVDLIMHRMVLK